MCIRDSKKPDVVDIRLLQSQLELRSDSGDILEMALRLTNEQRIEIGLTERSREN